MADVTGWLRESATKSPEPPAPASRTESSGLCVVRISGASATPTPTPNACVLRCARSRATAKAVRRRPRLPTAPRASTEAPLAGRQRARDTVKAQRPARRRRPTLHRAGDGDGDGDDAPRGRPEALVTDDAAVDGILYMRGRRS
ncbi:hypothetical protein AURDEDRAFT_161011 [Auricularia subglabra TFB-10046 SS5]|nr:hypothetical protein AURDEDRAFT_161011 [Auricularia subglabra TFB-10046 SS5]